MAAAAAAAASKTGAESAWIVVTGTELEIKLPDDALNLTRLAITTDWISKNAAEWTTLTCRGVRSYPPNLLADLANYIIKLCPSLTKLRIVDKTFSYDPAGMSAFLSTLSASPLPELDISGNKVSYWVGEPIATYIKLSKSLTTLDIRNNHVDGKGLVKIAKAVHDGGTVQTLFCDAWYASHNCISDVFEALMGNNSAIQTLVIEHLTEFDDASAEVVVKYIVDNKRLRTLCCTDTKVTDTGALDFFNGIRNSSSVADVVVDGPHISQKTRLWMKRESEQSKVVSNGAFDSALSVFDFTAPVSGQAAAAAAPAAHRCDMDVEGTTQAAAAAPTSSWGAPWQLQQQQQQQQQQQPGNSIECLAFGRTLAGFAGPAGPNGPDELAALSSRFERAMNIE